MSSTKSKNKKIILYIVLFIFISSITIFLIENKSNRSFSNIFDSFYWTIVTITTVGYGNQVPISIFGKIFSIIVMIFGVITISIITGKVASFLVDRKIKERRGLVDIKEISNHIVVCGWKNDLPLIIKNILKVNRNLNSKNIVLVSNISEDQIAELKLVKELKEINIIKGDHFNSDVLKRAKLSRAKKIIILADSTNNKTVDETDSQTMMAAMAIDKLGGTYTCAELLNPKYEKYLKLANCDEIIYTNEYSKIMLANASSSTGILNIFHDLINPNTKIKIFTNEITESFINKKYINLQKEYSTKNNVSLIGILENTGSKNIIKEKAILNAQKTPDISELVNNLSKVKDMEFNKPIFIPDKDYLIKENSLAIILGEEN